MTTIATPEFFLACAERAYAEGNTRIGDKFLVMAQQVAMGQRPRWA